jgi:hypothetical protein
MMNDGVKILLARMETHPEEFIYNPHEDANKWSRLMNSFRHCLTLEEINALDEGIRDIERDRFTELVMQELLDPNEDKQGELDLRASHQHNQTVAQQVAMIKALHDAKEEELLPYQTTYGRLYNHANIND